MDIDPDSLDLPLGSQVCYCRSCNQYFSSPASFDAHRPGRDLPVTCLTPAQMLARGMARNKYGRWVTELWTDAAQARMEGIV